MIDHEIACAFTRHFLWPALPSPLLIEYGNEICGDDWLRPPKPNKWGSQIMNFTQKCYEGNLLLCFMFVCVCLFVCLHMHKVAQILQTGLFFFFFFFILCILE